MAKVSVIMPSLNVIDYIKESVESVMQQTLKDIEIICIDAGSDDGTLEYIQSVAMADKRIHVIKSPVKSYGYQVNLGIDHAKGEYIAILETDDYVTFDMYEKLYNIAVSKNLDFVKCDYCTYTTEKGKRSFIERRVSAENSLYEEVFSPIDNPHTVIDDWYLWNGMYKADFLRQNKIFFSETSGAAFQDVGFLHKVATRAQKATYLKDSLYRYCVDREGASSNSKHILNFIRKEYGLLLESDFAYSFDEKRLLYIRMARSFIRACMDSDNATLLEEGNVNICKWFLIKLLVAEQEGCVTEADLPGALKDGYRHLLNPAVGYIAYRKSKERALIDFLGHDSKIIVFGCGNYGKDAAEHIKNKGYSIYGFMDNNQDLWGESVNGIPIFSPDKVMEMPKDTKYIVANEKYASAIKEQLRKCRDGVCIFEYVPEK